jgi:hypothetical protein
MPEASPLPSVVTLRSALKTVDAQLANGTLSPERVEDIKSAIDEIRFRLWGVMTADTPGEYQAFRERFRLRRAAEICHGLAADFADRRIGSAHREVEDLKQAIRALLGTMPGA